MGSTDFIQQGLRGLGAGIDAGRQQRVRDEDLKLRQDEAGMRSEEFRQRQENERVKRERLQSLDEQSRDLFREAAANPEFSRQDAVERLQPFSQASLEFQDPNILRSAAGPIEQIFSDRENAANRASRESVAGQKSEIQKGNLQLKKDKADKASQPKTFEQKLDSLGSEEKKRLDLVSTGLFEAEAVEQALADGDTIIPEKATGVTGDNNFTTARRNLTDVIGRLRSGGAINSDEETRFMNMIPRALDNEEARKNKLKGLKQEFRKSFKTLGFSEEEVDKFRPEAEEQTPPGQVIGKKQFEALQEENSDLFIQAVREENAERAQNGLPEMTPEESQQAIQTVLEGNGIIFDPQLP